MIICSSCGCVDKITHKKEGFLICACGEELEDLYHRE